MSSGGGLINLVEAATALTQLIDTSRCGEAYYTKSPDPQTKVQANRIVSDDDEPPSSPPPQQEQKIPPPPVSVAVDIKPDVVHIPNTNPSAKTNTLDKTNCHAVSDHARSDTNNTTRSNSPSVNANNGGKEIFPQRLMHMLSQASVSDAITWLPHGRSFVVVRPDVFAERVLPQYFPESSTGGGSKYPSFTRKLNRWGFRQVCRGPDAGAFNHRLFRRDEPELCIGMVCQKSRRAGTTGGSKTLTETSRINKESSNDASVSTTKVSLSSSSEVAACTTNTLSDDPQRVSQSLPPKKRKLSSPRPQDVGDESGVSPRRAVQRKLSHSDSPLSDANERPLGAITTRESCSQGMETNTAANAKTILSFPHQASQTFISDTKTMLPSLIPQLSSSTSPQLPLLHIDTAKGLTGLAHQIVKPQNVQKQQSSASASKSTTPFPPVPPRSAIDPRVLQAEGARRMLYRAYLQALHG